MYVLLVAKYLMILEFDCMSNEFPAGIVGVAVLVAPIATVRYCSAAWVFLYILSDIAVLHECSYIYCQILQCCMGVPIYTVRYCSAA